MNVREVSVLTPTFKSLLELPPIETTQVKIVERLISSEQGLGRARNSLAELATTDTFVYLDEDVLPPEELWELVSQLEDGFVIMAAGRNHPVTRVTALNKRTFEMIGGFDPRIRRTGEDLDLWLRATRKDMSVRLVNVTNPKPTPKNTFADQLEASYVRVKNGYYPARFFLRYNPVELVGRAIGIVYYLSRKKLLGDL